VQGEVVYERFEEVFNKYSSDPDKQYWTWGE
jgi:hypothetical protein